MFFFSPHSSPGDLPSGPDPVSADELTDRLRALHDEYAEQVNLAIAEGRDDLVREYADQYADEALALMTAGARPSV